MTSAHWKYRWRPSALIVGFGGLALVLLVTGVIVGVLGQDVLLITPHDPTIVRLNRDLFTPGQPVASLYGNPLSEPVRVILPATGSLIHPPEDPSLTLLPVDRSRGDHPLQARTVWFFTRFLVLGFLGVGLVGLFLPRRPQRRISGARPTAY